MEVIIFTRLLTSLLFICDIDTSDVSLFALPPFCSVTDTVNQDGNSVLNSVVSITELTFDFKKYLNSYIYIY